MRLETPRGMRDFLPEEKIKRDEIINKIRTVFENYGFVPLETPVMENLELLKGKYGEEEKLIYEFKDKAGRRLGLSFDLTVPLARIIAANPQLPKPFKRYVIDKVWRYDRPGKLRGREFYQCDIDTIGVESSFADAECLACINSALKAIGLKNFKFRINSRKLMNQLLKDAGVSSKNIVFALRILDKLDKIGEKEVRKQLKKKISSESANQILELINCRGNFTKVCKCFTIDSEIQKGINEFLKYLKNFGITNYIFDISLARGLDYYTGFIFEIDAGKNIGSIGGGGRYDNLVKQISGITIPAIGISLGLERVLFLLKKPKKMKKTKTQIYVIPIKTLQKSIKLVQQLREANINTDLDLMGRSLSKNLNYAGKLGINWAILVGLRDLKENKVTIRNMETGREKKVKLNNLIQEFKKIL